MIKTTLMVDKQAFKRREQKPKRHHFFTSECHTDCTACVLCVFVGRSRL